MGLVWWWWWNNYSFWGGWRCRDIENVVGISGFLSLFVFWGIVFVWMYWKVLVGGVDWLGLYLKLLLDCIVWNSRYCLVCWYWFMLVCFVLIESVDWCVVGLYVVDMMLLVWYGLVIDRIVVFFVVCVLCGLDWLVLIFLDRCWNCGWWLVFCFNFCLVFWWCGCWIVLVVCVVLGDRCLCYGWWRYSYVLDNR